MCDWKTYWLVATNRLYVNELKVQSTKQKKQQKHKQQRNVECMN